jgi:hypothetical protein
MDFKSFNKDRHNYDAILVIIDRLGKRLFFLFTHKTCTAADLAELYYTFFGAFLELLKRLFRIVARNL